MATATSASSGASTWRRASLSADFDGREVMYGFGGLDELVLAYATTIHRSQGSEYPGVYGSDLRQAPGGAGRTAEGVGDRRQGSTGAAALVKVAELADKHGTPGKRDTCISGLKESSPKIDRYIR